MKYKTAIRLGVVFAMGSLVFLGLWLLASPVRELSNRLVCQANMKTIVAAMKMGQSDASVPSAARIDRLIQLGHVQREQATCPSSGAKPCTYRIVGGAALLASLQPGTVVMFEPKSNHGGLGGNILFADGHAMFYRGAEYDAIVTKVGGNGE